MAFMVLEGNKKGRLRRLLHVHGNKSCRERTSSAHPIFLANNLNIMFNNISLKIQTRRIKSI